MAASGRSEKTAAAPAASIRNWLKTHSFVNAFAFPGTRKARGGASYDVHGAPFGNLTRRSLTCAGATQHTKLVWVGPDGAPSRAGASGVLPAVLVERKVSGKSSARCVVYICHGNACDAGEMAGEAALWSDALDAHVLVAEYPGYGVADGNPSEASVDAAVDAGYAYIRHHLRVADDRLVVVGRSIGTGPATRLAACMSHGGSPPAAVVLHAPYLSIRKLAVDLFGRIANIIMQRWDTERNVQGVNAPVLILHAKDDQIIPYSHAQQLHADAQRRHDEVGFDVPVPKAAMSCTSASTAPPRGGPVYPPVVELHTQADTADHNEYDLVADVLMPAERFLRKHVAPRGESVSFAADGLPRAAGPSGVGAAASLPWASGTPSHRSNPRAVSHVPLVR